MASTARPLVLAFLALLAGLLPGLRLAPEPMLPALLAAGVLLLPVLLAGTRHRLPRALGGGSVWSAFALVGLALGGAAARSAAGDCRALLPDQAELIVRGTLAANTLSSDGEDGPPPLLPVYVSGASVAGRPLARCGGVLRVRFAGRATSLAAGTVLELQGEWTRMASPVVPSRWPSDPRFAGFLRADSVRIVHPPGFASHALLTLRGRTEAHLQRLFPQHGPLAEALLLGRRERVDPALRDRFARAGMAHLLAISGMHVGLLAGILLLTGSWLQRVRQLPRRTPVWFTIGGLALYLAVIGAPPSAVRAGVMICLALLGLMLQRPFAVLPVVAAAALVMVALRPMTVLEPGFQLSFCGVLGILAFRSAIFPRLPSFLYDSPWRRYTAEMALASTAASLATAPAVVWHFGLLSPVGLLSNLVGIPLMGVGLVGLVAAAVAAPLIPPLGRLLALGTEVAFELLDLVATLAAALPYGHTFVARPQAWFWVAAALALLLTLDAAARLRTGLRWATAAGMAVVVLGAGPVAAGMAAGERGSLELHFLDVGQGDAIAIRTPADRWVVVDAGPADPRFDAGERRVLPFLRARGVRRLEAMILTHPHLDHIGGAPALLRALPTGALIEPGRVTGSSPYLELLRTAEARQVPWRAARSGRVLQLDGVRFEILWPDSQMLDAGHDANEISTIVLVRFGAFAALLTGDAYVEQERTLVRRHGAGLRAQVLKAGHHGSYTSTSPELLEAVRPELVVISAGRRNRFGHPAPEVLQELSARGIPVARTDRMGTVSVVVEAAHTPHWYLASP